MLKRILLPLAAALALGCIASAQNIKTLENDRYSISNGDVTLTVDAARGAKILSFQCNGKEVLSQSQRPNAFGSTFWTSPQSEWNWPPVPEYDSRPYNAEQKNGALVLTGPTSEKFKYHINSASPCHLRDGIHRSYRTGHSFCSLTSCNQPLQGFNDQHCRFCIIMSRKRNAFTRRNPLSALCKRKTDSPPFCLSIIEWIDGNLHLSPIPINCQRHCVSIRC